MTWRQWLLSAIAHPQIAYPLLSLGTLGLTIELWNPGAIVPGIVGGVCLLLAFFAFQVLPINYAGVALILFGVLLLVLEVKVASFGLLAVGGLVEVVRERFRESGSRYLVDAYCGVGFFSLAMADLAELYVVIELDAQAIQAARRNAINRERSGGEFLEGDTEELLPKVDGAVSDRFRHGFAGWTSSDTIC